MSHERRTPGRDIVEALVRSSGAGGEEAEELSRQAEANEAVLPDSSYLDIFVVLSVHGESFAKSFHTVVRDTPEELWDFLMEYLAVEIEWRCQDQGKEPDYSSLASACFCRLNRKTGEVTPLRERIEFERILSDEESRKDAFAVMELQPSAQTLELLTKLYREVDPDASWQGFLADSR